MLLLEEGQERGLRLYGYDPSVVEPDAVEDEAQELALGRWIVLLLPEQREVPEHLAGLVDAGDRGRWPRAQGRAGVGSRGRRLSVSAGVSGLSGAAQIERSL